MKYSRPLRVLLNLIMMLALVSALPARAAMFMAMDSQGAAQHMVMEHGQMMSAMTDDASHHDADLPVQHGQQDQCQCGAHCGACGACHSIMSELPINGFVARIVAPDGPLSSHPAEIWLPRDPRPPRA